MIELLVVREILGKFVLLYLEKIIKIITRVKEIMLEPLMKNLSLSNCYFGLNEPEIELDISLNKSCSQQLLFRLFLSLNNGR